MTENKLNFLNSATVTQFLIKNAEVKYAEFTKKLVPDTNYKILGIKVPLLKCIAKYIAKNSILMQEYLSTNHIYYEEWFIHGLVLGYSKLPIEDLLIKITQFLPYIDNWAICDSVVANLKIFKKNSDISYSFACSLLSSKFPYVIRFAIIMFLDYNICELFIDKILLKLSNLKNDNYYVEMAISWFLSVSAIKFNEKIYNLLENRKFCKFITNKTISKISDSYRFNQQDKIKFNKLKI